MQKTETKNIVKEPITDYGKYSYADYLTWQIDEVVELIKGKVFKMNSAPKRLHQKISLKVAIKLYNFLEGKTCEVYEAPFDVRLPVKSKGMKMYLQWFSLIFV